MTTNSDVIMAQATIEIKTHQEEFTEPEIFLRRKLEEIIPENIRNYTTQSDLDNLKEYRATSDTFFPENHFYAFEGNDLLGFIHLWPQFLDEKAQEIATMSIPFVKDGNEDVAEKLLQAVINRAKDLGVKTLQINTPSENSLELGIINQLGFSYNDVNRVYSTASIDKLNVEPTDQYRVIDFDREVHGEAVLEMYETLGHDRSNIENQFTWVTDLNERLLGWKVAVNPDTDKIMGQAVCFTYPHDEESETPVRAQLNTVTRGIDVDDETYEKVTRDLYSVLLDIANSAEVSSVDLNIMPQVLELRPIYENFGFEFQQSDSYHKDIDQF